MSVYLPDPCPDCGWLHPAEFEGEAIEERWCPRCEEYEATCPLDHCMICGAST